MLTSFEKNGFLNIFKTDFEVGFVFDKNGEFLSDSKKEKIEGLMFQYGREISKEMFNNIKKMNIEDYNRNVLVSIDYISDLLSIRKRKGKNQ